MAGLLHSESRRLYSWWWDSHISPKSSKWLQENLTDMDAKVKAMIKLIEEDADSFARRAEMYYKKRPELMKLVEEFYRAYRALAERYDNVTVELRFAHRRMAEAFPNQVPFLPDDSPSGSISSDAEPQTPVLHPIRKIFDSDDQHSDTAWLSSSTVDPESSSKIRRGLKQLNEMFGSGEKGLDSLIVPIENSCITNQKLSAAEEAGEAELELQALKKVLAEMQAEKEAVLAQYQQSMEKLTDMEKTLGVAQENARGFDDQRSRAEIEISKLNEALANSEAERDSGLLQYNQTLSKISELETNISLSEENAKGLGERAIEAETQLQHLRQEIMRLEAEKEAGLHQYDKCLCRISSLEGKILIAEENARVLSKKNDQLEAEIERLKQAVDELNEEKEAVSHQYKLCLDIIARLESEVSQAHENVKQLNGEISRGATLLKNAEETNATLKKSNQSLVLEVDDLMDKIGKKDQEILDKQNELEKLQICMQDEHSRLLHVEASLNAWQEVHCQSQERQESLALELKNGLEMLKDFEISKHSLEEKIFQANEENRCLNELNLSSADSIKHLQAEIAGLREMKEKLQEEVSRQVDQSNSLQQEIFNLKEEINDLNSRYQALLEQLETVGFTPESDWSSLGKLLDESSMLKEMCKKQQDENDGLLKKLGNMETLLEKNAYLENSLLNANGEIERSKEKLHALQESCQFFQGEKSSLVSEKAILLSQLQVVTESMRKLLEKNSVLDNSLAIANVEIAGLREKSKSLEEICQMIRNEKSNLHMERSTLISQLESVQERLKRLENRFTELEEKYCGLEKEKNSTLHQVEELRISFGAEKKQHEIFTISTEAQLATLENQITLLQNQGGFKKKEFEEELEKAVKAQVELFILQKFVKDLEEKNSSLSAERQKLLEASKFSDKLISQLNMENLEQQVETEFLLDEIERLRSSIYQVFKALQIDSEIEYKCKIDHEDRFLVLIQKHFESIKNDLSRNMEEKQQLLVENLVLVSLMGQLELESIEFASAKRTADHSLQMVKEQLAVVQCEKQELQEMNKKLKLEISERVQREDLFRADKESLEVKIDKLEEAYILSQDQNLKTLEEMKSLSKECSELKKNVCMLEDENDAVLHEAIVSGNLSLLFQSLGDERAAKLEVVVEHLDHLNKANSNLEKEVFLLMEKLETIGREHVSLKDSMEKNDRELHEFKSLNDRLNAQILVQTECLMKKEAQCSEAEQMLEASEKKNRQLHIINEALDEECRDLKLKSEQKICSLTRENETLSEDIKNLSDMNGRMVSNLDELAEEIEKYRIREDNLCSELLQKGHDFEIWEAEAATFYFDLQVSTVHEVLYANKIQELAGVCATLEEESASKDVHIELMEEKIKVLESHVDVLKSQLSAYIPAVDLLTEDIASLEHNAFLWTKHHVNSCHDSKVVQSPDDCEEYYCKELVEPGSGMMPDRISELQEFRCRLKAVERAVAKDAERLAKHDSLEIKLEAAMKEIEQLKFKRASIQVKRNPQDQKESRDELKVNLKLKIPNSSPSVAQEIQMKDIQLDQVSDSSVGGISKIGYNGTDDEMLEMWEAAEKNYKLEPRIHSRSLDKSGGHIQDACQNREGFSLPLQVKKELGVDKLSRSPSESDRERNKRKIVEKLTSDAQKLMSIQDLVQELRKKMMATKCKKSKVVEFETVREQLQEIDESLIQLMDINCQLVRKTEGSPSSSGRRDPIELEEARGSQRKRIVEQVRRESEKIARLQLEVKKIQYILLKQEEEKKTSRQYRFSKSKTSIVLSNFIHSGSRNSRRRKKGCLSGCMRKPSTPENEVVTGSFRAG